MWKFSDSVGTLMLDFQKIYINLLHIYSQLLPLHLYATTLLDNMFLNKNTE